jgi:hypothetical protein
VVIDRAAIMREKMQALHTDMMHVNGHKFLVSLVEPLQLTTQAPLENETADQLDLGLQGWKQTTTWASNKLHAEEQSAEVPVRRSAQIASGVQPPWRYILLTRIKDTTKKWTR